MRSTITGAANSACRARMIRRANGITGLAPVRDGFAAAREAVEFVEARTKADGFLLGSAFPRADLVAASHLAVLCDPPSSPMERLAPRPAAVEDLCASLSQKVGYRVGPARLSRLSRRSWRHGWTAVRESARECGVIRRRCSRELQPRKKRLKVGEMSEKC